MPSIIKYLCNKCTEKRISCTHLYMKNEILMRYCFRWSTRFGERHQMRCCYSHQYVCVCGCGRWSIAVAAGSSLSRFGFVCANCLCVCWINLACQTKQAESAFVSSDSSNIFVFGSDGRYFCISSLSCWYLIHCGPWADVVLFRPQMFFGFLVGPTDDDYHHYIRRRCREQNNSNITVNEWRPRGVFYCIER